MTGNLVNSVDVILAMVSILRINRHVSNAGSMAGLLEVPEGLSLNAWLWVKKYENEEEMIAVT